MGKYLSWLGVLAGAVSLFRLLHLAIGFGLSKPTELVLGFYVAFFHPLVDLLRPVFLPIAHAMGLVDLPPWWREVFIVYALIGAALSRQTYAAGNAANQRRPGSTKPIQDAVISALFWPLIPVIVRETFRNEEFDRDWTRAQYVGWSAEILKVIGATGVFLLTNAAMTYGTAS